MDTIPVVYRGAEYRFYLPQGLEGEAIIPIPGATRAEVPFRLLEAFVVKANTTLEPVTKPELAEPGHSIMLVDEIRAIIALVSHLHRQTQGSLGILRNHAGEWVVSYEWGEEAEDSNMAGAASYGTGDNLLAAFHQVIIEVFGG